MLMFLSDDAERFCRSRGLQVSTRYVNLTEENLREFYLGNRQRIARQGHIHKNPESGESVDKAGRKYLEGLVKRFAGERGVYLLVTGPNAVNVVAELFDHGGARYRELFSNADAPRTPDEVEHDLRALSGMTPEAMLHEEAFRAPARV